MKRLIGKFGTILLVAGCFVLSSPLKAQCPSACSANGNTAVGSNVLDSVTTGINNTAVGANALTDDTLGAYNVAVGSGALASNTTGNQNMAIGAEALAANMVGNFNMAIGFRSLNMNTGNRNSAVGAAALLKNAGASDNTAIGSQALKENSTGEENTAIGAGAMQNANNGNDNTAVGFSAGSALGNGNGNIDIGSGVVGVAGENNNIRIGTSLPSNGILVGDTPETGETVSLGTGLASGGISVSSNFNRGFISIGANIPALGSSTFVGGIFAHTPPAGSHLVTVAANGQLADATASSRRFKKDIAPIDKISEGILALKPVTFHLKNDDTNYPQFGLVAEEVVEVNPDWITRDAKGEIYGVRYETIPILLLNEFLKEHKRVEQQTREIQEQKETISDLKKGMDSVVAEIKEQASRIQKVSAGLELNKGSERTVAEKN